MSTTETEKDYKQVTTQVKPAVWNAITKEAEDEGKIVYRLLHEILTEHLKTKGVTVA